MPSTDASRTPTKCGHSRSAASRSTRSATSSWAGQVFEPGWRWSLHIQPIAGTSHCEYHHMGYVISGAMRIVLEDGTSYDVGRQRGVRDPASTRCVGARRPDLVSLDWARDAIVRVGRSSPEVSGRWPRSSSPTWSIRPPRSRRPAMGSGATCWPDHNQAVRFELDRFRGREIDDDRGRLPGHLRRRGTSGSLRRRHQPCRPGARALDRGPGSTPARSTFVTGDVRGIAVHAAARVMALAGPGEVLVSGTTHELLEGSGLAFEDRGPARAQGDHGARQVFALVAHVKPAVLGTDSAPA